MPCPEGNEEWSKRGGEGKEKTAVREERGKKREECTDQGRKGEWEGERGVKMNGENKQTKGERMQKLRGAGQGQGGENKGKDAIRQTDTACIG